MVDAIPRAELTEWLALAWREGEPWEHTAKLCWTMFLIQAAVNGSEDAQKELAKEIQHGFMPKHVRPPTAKDEPQNEPEIVKDATTTWMERMIKRGKRG